LGAQVTEIPFIEIRRPRSFLPLDRALRRISDYDWLVLTSVNGVQALFLRLRKVGVSRPQLQHLKIAVIGPATKAAIESHGLRVEVLPTEYVAESVVEKLRGKVKGKRILLARARVARDVIPKELRERGAEVEVVEAYRTEIPKASRARLLSLLKDGSRRPEVITFTSSSTARNFGKMLGKQGRLIEGVKLASIGPVTSATLRQLGFEVDIEAKTYTVPGLIHAIRSSCRG